MKKVIAGILIVILCVPLFCVNFSAATQSINIPYAETAPVIDGDGNDEIWKSAYKETLNPTVAAKAGNYVQERNNTTNAATADINVLWNEKGLYFKWVVVDPTQSFALDLPSPGLNAMDGIQVVIDPFYKRFASVKNCAFCFTFVPYTCPRGSGVGQVPTGECSWYEHWQWVGINETIGVKMKASLDKENDNNDDGLDQIILVHGYTIEAFLPVEALAINGTSPTFKASTNIGIGFMLMDYLYNHEKFLAAKGAVGGAEASQEVYNFCMDYSSSKKDVGKPAKYMTAVLVKGEVPTAPVTPFDALQTSIKQSDEYIAKKDQYTQASIAALQSVLDEAKKLTNSASDAECTAMQEKLGAAASGLVLLADDTLENQIKIAESIVSQYESETPPYPASLWDAFISAFKSAKDLVAKPAE